MLRKEKRISSAAFGFGIATYVLILFFLSAQLTRAIRNDRSQMVIILVAVAIFLMVLGLLFEIAARFKLRYQTKKIFRTMAMFLVILLLALYLIAFIVTLIYAISPPDGTSISIEVDSFNIAILGIIFGIVSLVLNIVSKKFNSKIISTRAAISRPIMDEIDANIHMQLDIQREIIFDRQASKEEIKRAIANYNQLEKELTTVEKARNQNSTLEVDNNESVYFCNAGEIIWKLFSIIILIVLLSFLTYIIKTTIAMLNEAFEIVSLLGSLSEIVDGMESDMKIVMYGVVGLNFIVYFIQFSLIMSLFLNIYILLKKHGASRETLASIRVASLLNTIISIALMFISLIIFIFAYVLKSKHEVPVSSLLLLSAFIIFYQLASILFGIKDLRSKI
ncbi:MAG: hypothetical protein ACOX56_06950 [Acholeplasmataceae bacterium]